MQFVAKADTDQATKSLRVLSESEATALKRYWSLEPDERPTHLLQTVGRLLAVAHTMEAWIQCDCSPNKPLLAPVQYKLEKYKLTRLSKRGEHDGNCPFHWEEGELGGTGTAAGHENVAPNKLPSSMNFLLFNQGEAEAAKGTGKGISRGRSRKHQHALQQQLYWLLSEAGLNVLDGTSLRRDDRLNKLVEVLRSHPIAPGSHIRMSEITWWSADALAKGWVQSRFDKLRREWPDNRRLQAYLLLRIHQIDSEKRELSDWFGTKLVIDGRLAVYGVEGKASGPYMALVTVTEENGKLTLPRAYVHPMRLDWINKESKEKYTDYFPVDSGYERSAANVLTKFVRRINGREESIQQPRVRVIKPLEDFDVSGIGCRPDFIVEDTQTGRTAVIETMGSTDPEYLDRKKGTHALMATLGSLILDERNRHERERADDLLESKLWAWFKGGVKA